MCPQVLIKCHTLRHVGHAAGDGAVRLEPAARRALPAGTRKGAPGAGLLRPGGTHPSVVPGRHPHQAARGRQRDQRQDRLPVPARGIGPARCSRPGPAPSPSGRDTGGLGACEPGGRRDPHRPDEDTRPEQRRPGGRASTSIMEATSRSSRHRTGGRCGPRPCVPAANTT